MAGMNIFQYVKDNIKISEFVEQTGRSKGLHRVGSGEYRTNNIIANGDNVNAMRIMDDDGYFTVFSHGQESGDIIELYRYVFNTTHEKRTESAINLARFMNLNIPDELLNKNYQSTTKLTDVLNKITIKANYYLMNSDNPDAIEARKYLEERKVPTKIVKDWKLGLFPSGNENAYKLVKSCGSLKELQAAGVLQKIEQRVPFMSMFGRLVFPLMNQHGDTIGYSSRIIDNVQHFNDSAKYINTSTTALYDKSKNLYGQHLFTKDVKNVVICEGNLDVIALNEVYSDDPETIALATCGTALTDEHAQLIKRNKVSNVNLLFDSDTAGVSAATKSIFLANYFNNASISHISGEKDPWDSYINGNDLKDYIAYNSSIIYDASYAAHNLFGDSEKMNNWVKRSYGVLNYAKHREELIENVCEVSNMRRSAIEKVLNGVKESKRKPSTKTEDSIDVSSGVDMIIKTLLTFGKKERLFVASPILFNKKEEKRVKILEILGSDNDLEDDAILSVLGVDVEEDIKKYAFNLSVPDEDIEPLRTVFVQTTAKKIINDWNTSGIPPMGQEFLQPLLQLANGNIQVDLVEAICTIFDILVLSINRK